MSDAPAPRCTGTSTRRPSPAGPVGPVLADRGAQRGPSGEERAGPGEAPGLWAVLTAGQSAQAPADDPVEDRRQREDQPDQKVGPVPDDVRELGGVPFDDPPAGHGDGRCLPAELLQRQRPQRGEQDFVEVGVPAGPVSTAHVRARWPWWVRRGRGGFGRARCGGPLAGPGTGPAGGLALGPGVGLWAPDTCAGLA